MKRRRCRGQPASCSRISSRVTSPVAHRREEIIDGLVFWPEVAEKLMRIAREGEFLLGKQFFNARMPLADILLSQRHRINLSITLHLNEFEWSTGVGRYQADFGWLPTSDSNHARMRQESVLSLPRNAIFSRKEHPWIRPERNCRARPSHSTIFSSTA